MVLEQDSGKIFTIFQGMDIGWILVFNMGDNILRKSLLSSVFAGLMVIGCSDSLDVHIDSCEFAKAVTTNESLMDETWDALQGYLERPHIYSSYYSSKAILVPGYENSKIDKAKVAFSLKWGDLGFKLYTRIVKVYINGLGKVPVRSMEQMFEFLERNGVKHIDIGEESVLLRFTPSPTSRYTVQALCQIRQT